MNFIFWVSIQRGYRCSDRISTSRYIQLGSYGLTRAGCMRSAEGHLTNKQVWPAKAFRLYISFTSILQIDPLALYADSETKIYTHANSIQYLLFCRLASQSKPRHIQGPLVKLETDHLPQLALPSRTVAHIFTLPDAHHTQAKNLVTGIIQ
jgi:hypothetical protein